jgi:hypothetical protein
MRDILFVEQLLLHFFSTLLAMIYCSIYVTNGLSDEFVGGDPKRSDYWFYGILVNSE